MAISTIGIRQGDRAGRVGSIEDELADLYARHASDAARLAYLLTGDRHAAEDIAHEAFARVGGRILGLKDPHKAAGYLFRTVANLSRGHGRALTRDRKLRDRIAPAEGEEQPDIAERDRLWQALMKLSHRHRAALYLRYYLGLSEAEAAEVLELSVSAMKSLTNRAVQACRKHLAEDQP
jgi:RNA polymerase sigma factor (sigma-70 family)